MYVFSGTSETLYLTEWSSSIKSKWRVGMGGVKLDIDALFERPREYVLRGDSCEAHTSSEEPSSIADRASDIATSMLIRFDSLAYADTLKLDLTYSMTYDTATRALPLDR
jgi:hypothetical protein